MTKITVNRLNGGFVFEAKGHAGYGEPGRDIVCAAASALCIALFERLTRLHMEKQLKIRYSHVVPGEMYIEVSCEDKLSPANETLETVCTGLRKLEEMYPENIVCEA